jgi:hypothetical protein
MRALSAGLASLAFLALSSNAFAAASGSFKVEGKAPIQPKFASAYEVRDQRDGRHRQVEVVLSEAAFDAAAAAGDLDPHTQGINQPALMEHNYILLWVSTDGHVSMNATYTDGMVQFIDETGQGLRADLKTNTADRISGRLYTPKPVKTMGGDSYQVDVTFDVEITRQKAGTVLGKDGGDPGKAFMALNAAINGKKWDAIQKALSADTRKRLIEDYRTPEENMKDTIDMLKIWLPKAKTKVTGGEMSGTAATLEVEGEVYEGRNGLWLVRMLREGDAWVFDRAAMAGLLPRKK